MERLNRRFENFRKALKKFEEVVNSSFFEESFAEEFKIEILTKRFEYLFEAFWQFVQIFLRERGVECFSPRSCFEILLKEGFLRGKEEILFEMIKLRNKIVHIYDEDMAREVYKELKEGKFLEIFKKAEKEFSKVLMPA